MPRGCPYSLSQVAKGTNPDCSRKEACCQGRPGCWVSSGQARVLGELRDRPESRLKNYLFEGPNRYSSRALVHPKAFSCSEAFHSCDSGSSAPSSSEGACLVSKRARHHWTPEKPGDPCSPRSWWCSASSEQDPERSQQAGAISPAGSWSLYFLFCFQFEKRIGPWAVF